MARDTEVDKLIINELKKEQYTSAEISDTELYYVTDEKIAIEDIDNLQEELDAKQAKLVAGPNITINPETNEISATGGGEPIDAYTKEETDGLLEKKQDKITPVQPLTLQTKAISSLVGYSYVPGTQNIYANYKYQYKPTGSWASPTLTLGNGWSYIDIPVDITRKQVITMPLITSSYSAASSCRFVMGKYDQDGNFNPIWAPMMGNSSNGMRGYWATDIVDTPPANAITTRMTDQGPALASGSGYGTLDKMYIQLNVEAGLINFYGLGCYASSTDKSLMKIVNATYGVDRFAEITVCRFLNMGMIQSVAATVSTTDFGRYTVGQDLTSLPIVDGRPDLSAFTNEYVIGEVQTHNYLEVHTDNTTIKVNSEGNLSVNTDAMAFGSELDYDGTNLSLLSPAGDTLSSVEISGGVKLFPITQAAYDELAVKDPNTLYIIKQETV